jgi:ankyrin repeat protein
MCQLLNPQLLLPALLSWQDIKGVTPLMLAARGGHADCLALLLQHGANPLLLDTVNRR